MKFFATVSAVAALSSLAVAAPGSKSCPVKNPKPGPGKGELKDFPWCFTSTYEIIATPEQVVNTNNTATPGEGGAVGYYNYGIQSELDLICWVSILRHFPQPFFQLTHFQHITLKGVTGPYQSPAITATHIHEAVKGRSGPPRIAFPNPEPANTGPEVVKVSMGCKTGPFLTGIIVNGTDTGVGFMVKEIEENPAGFFTDAHTVKFTAGVVRGQLDQ